MSQLFSKITSALSSDVAFLFVLFVIFFVCIMYFGKNRMASILLVFYPAVFAFDNLPFLNKLVFLSGERGIILSKLIVFIAIFLLLYFGLKKYFVTFNETTGFIGKAGLSLGFIIAFVFFSYTVVSLDLLHSFSGSIDGLVVEGNREFWWGLAPLVILAIF